MKEMETIIRNKCDGTDATNALKMADTIANIA